MQLRHLSPLSPCPPVNAAAAETKYRIAQQSGPKQRSSRNKIRTKRRVSSDITLRIDQPTALGAPSIHTYVDICPDMPRKTHSPAKQYCPVQSAIFIQPAEILRKAMRGRAFKSVGDSNLQP